MNNKGFGNQKKDLIKGVVNKTEVNKLLKKYKDIKKYQRSPFYEVKKLDGTETVIKNLLEDNKNQTGE